MDQTPKKAQIPALIHKHMPEYDADQITLSPLLGMTNQTFKVQAPGKKPLVFRIFQGIFDRKKENLLVAELSQHGIAPKCYYMSEIYRIEEFVENAKHPQPQDIRTNPQTLKLILGKLSTFHRIKLPQIFQKRVFTDKIFMEETKQRYLKTSWPIKSQVQQFQRLKNAIMGKFDDMKMFYQKIFKANESDGKKIKFCHNDLNNLNIFIRQKIENEQIQKQCIFIDFQYGCFNYIAYDIANTISESCFTYSSQVPGFIVKETVDEALVKKACSLYPNRYEQMEFDVAAMLVIVNFYWGMWSLETQGVDDPQQKSNSSFKILKHGEKRLELCQIYNELTKKMSKLNKKL